MKSLKQIFLGMVLVLLFFVNSVLVYAKQDLVKVGFIDTGVSLKHIESNFVEKGQNYIFPERDTSDRIGHGTATAGIVLGSKVLGLEGIFPKAQVVPLVIFDSYPSGIIKSGGVEAICKAIYDAIDVYGCRVINVSMGVTENSKQLHEAVLYAEKKGAVLISAVGNANAEEPDKIYYPAAYSTVIGVGSSNGTHIAEFSQRNNVFVVSQGVDISCVTIRNEQEPETFSGTSYSCAFVSGVCAKIISEYPQITPSKVRVLLAISATDILERGFDIDSGWGMIRIDPEKDGAPLLRGEAVDIMAALAEVLVNEELIDESEASRVLFQGVNEEDFSLETPLTRAMAVTVLHRFAGLPKGRNNTRFKDVPSSSWYTDAVIWAAEAGIAKGVSNDCFSPDEAVTREQMLTFLSRYVCQNFDISV